MSDEEDRADASAVMGHMMRMAEDAEAAGYDAESFMSGYMAIEGPETAAGAGLGMRAGLLSRPIGGATPSSRGRLWSPTMLARATRGIPGRVAPRVAREALAPRLAARDPGPVGDSYLPLDSQVAIPGAGGIATITTVSQTIFRPRALNIPRSIIDFFLILQFTIGNVNVAAAPGAIPAGVFASDATQREIRRTTAGPGISIVLQVQNIDGADHRFLAALFGPSSQPEGCE